MTNPPPNGRDSPADPPPPSRSVEPLDYAKPQQTHGSFRARVLGGCVAYILISAAWFRHAGGLRWDRRRLWAGWLVMTGVLLALSLYLRLRHQRAGYGYGILLALGLAILLVGGVVLLIISLCGHGGRI